MRFQISFDNVHRRCPDLVKIIKTFKVRWHEVPGWKTWFMNVLPHVISEMYREGKVSEKFYDEHNFLKDSDQKGKI